MCIRDRFQRAYSCLNRILSSNSKWVAYGRIPPPTEAPKGKRKQAAGTPRTGGLFETPDNPEEEEPGKEMPQIREADMKPLDVYKRQVVTIHVRLFVYLIHLLSYCQCFFNLILEEQNNVTRTICVNLNILMFM